MHFKTTLLAAAVLLTAGSAHAALFDRGNGMVYDNTRNITWLADMNYAKTSGASSDGLMTWEAATKWAGTLSYGGYSGWRLPTLKSPDASCSGSSSTFGYSYGYNCTGGELSGLFVAELGIKRGESVLNPTGDTDEQKANLKLFKNVPPLFTNFKPVIYWSGLIFCPDCAFPGAFDFSAESGAQNLVSIAASRYVVVVRDGDVTSAVPEPETYALMLAGLGLVAGIARRRSKLQ
ncbi:PEP-CTERM sorting domain-containing protein [Roseateles albus]|uniref:PEP-CTERM sorting domain-containing protein n=1 Tax=Roseateles albus TaxID=2987525 RepID=A0ABT5KCY9_9BURK|nr:PEP-CTERM sorting domain-containing protein [Roseateles albus]MDC8771793.1 PEP-CTERM sorting domain-containing protein [Roseateles albus]